MRQDWGNLPAWIRGPYRPIFDAANMLLDEGDDVAAIEMIAAAEANSSITGDATVYAEYGNLTKADYFAAVKAQFAAGISALD